MTEVTIAVNQALLLQLVITTMQTPSSTMDPNADRNPHYLSQNRTPCDHGRLYCHRCGMNNPVFRRNAPATPGTTNQTVQIANSDPFSPRLQEINNMQLSGRDDSRQLWRRQSSESPVRETPEGDSLTDRARTQRAAMALMSIHEDPETPISSPAPSIPMTEDLEDPSTRTMEDPDTPPSRQPLHEVEPNSPFVSAVPHPILLSCPSTSEETSAEEWDSPENDTDQENSALLLDTTCSRIPRAVENGRGKHLLHYATLLTQSTTLAESAMRMGGIISIASSISTENSKQKMYTGSVLGPPDQVRAQAALDTLIATYCLFQERLSTLGTMSPNTETLSSPLSKDHLLEVLTQHAKTCGQEAFLSQQKASFLRTLKSILRVTMSSSTETSPVLQTAFLVKRWRPQEFRITKRRGSKSTGRPTQRQDDGYWRAYTTQSIESNDYREETPTPPSRNSSTGNSWRQRPGHHSALNR